jgi:hypothetical protein
MNIDECSPGHGGEMSIALFTHILSTDLEVIEALNK